MNTLIRLLRNILELIGVLFKFIFSKIEDGVGILLMGREQNTNIKRAANSWRENINFPKKKKDLVYSSTKTARRDEEKEARIRQLMKVQATTTEFDTGLEDEYLYTKGSRWATVEDYEEPIGI